MHLESLSPELEAALSAWWQQALGDPIRTDEFMTAVDGVASLAD